MLNLVQQGKAAATIIIPSDGSYYHSACQIERKVLRHFGVKLPIVTANHAPLALTTPHAIALGCLADNPFIAALYFRWNTLVDRWYPGPDGWVMHTIPSPHQHGEHVLLLGGSDSLGINNVVREFLNRLETFPGGMIPWIFDVRLGSSHLPLPEDRIDILGTAPSQIIIPENALPENAYTSGFNVGLPCDHLLRLGMYGPHADNFHFSRSSEFGLRYFYTGLCEDGERYAKTLLSEARTGVLSKLYHYKSLRMFQLWSLFAHSPIFKVEEVVEITNAIRSYLLEESGIANLAEIRAASSSPEIFNRHLACDALNLWVGTDWLWRQTGETAWIEKRAIADIYFEGQVGVDVPLTGLTEGYASYLEVFLEWMLLSRPEQIAKNSHLRIWADRVIGLCTNTGNLALGPQTDTSRYPYNLLLKLAYLLNDGHCRFVADLRERQLQQGMDRVLQFSAGQAYASDVPAIEPSNGLNVYPMNERLRQWKAPSIALGQGFDRIVARSGWCTDDDYLMLIGVRGGAKALPTVGSLASYERFGQRLITSDLIPLYPACASPWRHSTVCINAGGIGFGLLEGATLLSNTETDNGHLCSIQMSSPDLGHWIRSLFWKPSAYVVVIDQVVLKRDSTLTIGINWRCGGQIETLDGNVATLEHGPDSEVRFHVQVSEGLNLTSETNAYPIPGSTPGTAPNRETMLHAFCDGQNESNSATVATLLHAVRGTPSPKFHLETIEGGWNITGPNETLKILQSSAKCRFDLKTLERQTRAPPLSEIVRTHSPLSNLPLPVRWSVDLPSPISAWTQSADGSTLGVGMDNGSVLVLDATGEVKWQNSGDSPVTSIKFHGVELIVGTLSGQVSRFSDRGITRWHHTCRFRDEREIWPWWFMTTPSIGAIAVGRDPSRGCDTVVVGSGSTNLHFLNAESGELTADVLSPYGYADRIQPHVSSKTGRLHFLVGHSRLTCGSTVQAWNSHAKSEMAYEKSIAPMGRSVDGWDSCGVVDFWAGALIANYDDRIVVLRHGAVNQLTVYDSATGDALWDATLGDAPIALVVVPGDKVDTTRCYVAGQFGSVTAFDGNGKPLESRTWSRSITGMQAGPEGSLALWKNNQLRILKRGLTSGCFSLEGTPLGLCGSAQNPGILGIRASQLVMNDIPW